MNIFTKILNFIKNMIKSFINFVITHIKAITIIAIIVGVNIWLFKSAYLKLFLESEIVKTNTLNFLIIVVFFAIIAKSLKISEKIDGAISKIKETIDNSEIAKSKSIEELQQATELVKNVGEEIAQIENNAQKNIINIEKKITQDSENQINSIKKNAEKIIAAKEKEITLNLSQKTVLASFELAKKHIINLLKRNPSYHQKFIKESIEELNRLK